MGLQRMWIGLGLFLVSTLAIAADTGMTDVDAAFDEVMARYGLPGLAVGIIENGEVVYRRTSGELVAGEDAPITAQTLFKIASNSKAMTTATLARLVDAGKLRWDDPVVRHLPHFRMSDPWVTREMQVRDLLIHNSGLRAGAGDLMLWPEPNHFTRADVIAGLAYLKPVHSFRSRYDYDNLMYIVAGEVAAAAGGAPYEELVRREVFEPVGLTRCQVGAWSPADVGNVAQPHARRDGRIVVVRRDGATVSSATMDAAGGIRCSLDDMLTWMRAWLRPEDAAHPWLSPSQRNAVWSAQMPIPVSRRQRDWEGSRYAAYGYGWRISDADGTFKVAHTGTLSGMYSSVTLLPQRGVGFVILINADAEDARTVLGQALLKHYTAPQSVHTVAHYAQRIERERSAPGANRAPDTSARRPLAIDAIPILAGVYRDAWFGEVSVCPGGGEMRFRAHKSPMLDGRLMRVGERILVDWRDDSVDAESWLDFTPVAHDGPATLAMAKVDPDADFSYDYEDLSLSRVRDCE